MSKQKSTERTRRVFEQALKHAETKYKEGFGVLPKGEALETSPDVYLPQSVSSRLAFIAWPRNVF